ncbi:CapA family protein [Patescibacteria group bacterium]|nr:CapA family protein [Patescibacteria group bacterium]
MITGVTVKYTTPRAPTSAKRVLSPTKPALQTKNKVVLIATGDIVIGRTVNYHTIKYQDPAWPFKKINELLSDGDITVANIESPIVPNCPTTVEGMVFCGREEVVQGIKESGIDVATLANNHIADFGVAGIENTVELLKKNGVEVTGLASNAILYQTVRNTKFAFLAFNDIYGSIPPVLMATNENIQKYVNEARQNADVVVVAMHWGAEYQATPDSRQVELAHLVADAGADLIIGNHPHWIQSDGQYKNTYIKYAHGNTIFDQMWSEETKKGVIGRYTFEDGRLTDKEFTPIYSQDYGQPAISTNL